MGSDDYQLSTGAGHMDVFFVQFGKILTGFQCTKHIKFADASNEFASITDFPVESMGKLFPSAGDLMWAQRGSSPVTPLNCLTFRTPQRKEQGN